MNNPGPLLRLLFQRLKAPDGGNLAQLVPRALADHELLPGWAEMAVTKSGGSDGGGWSSAGLLVPRTYMGYVAVHYVQTIDQYETFPDEANICRVLETFGLLPGVQAEPHFRDFGNAPADWFLNTEPGKARLPPVLTLSFDWQLEIDLTLKEGPPP